MIARRLGSAGQRVAVAMPALFAVVIVGTVGYRLIEGWAWFDSLYMTVITVATVGFSEVHPLSEAGRAFTILLIVTGISVQFIALATIVDYLTGRTPRRNAGRTHHEPQDRGPARPHHRVRHRPRRLGRRARARRGGRRLHHRRPLGRGRAKLCREEGWLIVQGDAAEEETLLAAGIERANSVVTALDSDADNLFVTVTARALNPKLFIVARSSHETSEQKILKAGANRVITPNVIGGRRMAGMVMQPVVSDYLDLVAHGEGVEFRLQEYSVAADPSCSGKTLSEARVRESDGCLRARGPQRGRAYRREPRQRLPFR